MQPILDALTFLQQPHWAIPICALAIAGIAVLTRKFKTAIYLVGFVVVLQAVWHLAPTPEGATGMTLDNAVLLAGVLGYLAVATWERAWTTMYVALMPIINWSFAAVPTAAIPASFGGGQFQPLAIVTGLVLVVRDFGQREVGNRILLAMLAGLVLSTLTSWITVVIASGAAFLISELVDWAVYTFTERPLSQRVLLSSCLSAPLDQVVFIYLASFVVPGIFAWGTVLTGILSKLIGAYVVYLILRRQEQRESPPAQVNPA